MGGINRFLHLKKPPFILDENMPIYSPTGFLDITNATLRTSNTECQNLQIGSGNVYVTTDLTSDLVLNLENITNLGATTSNTVVFSNAITGLTVSSNLVATGNVTAGTFLGNGSGLTNIPPSAITGTLSQWSDGTNSDVYIASNVGIGNVHTLTSNTLQVGANLYVRDADANVLTVTGNVAATRFVGDGSLLTGIASNLHQVVENGNVTSNTVQFTNATTGFITTSNVEIGGTLKINTISAAAYQSLQSVTDVSNSTSNTVRFTNATTGFTTTSNIDVGGRINMGGHMIPTANEQYDIGSAAFKIRDMYVSDNSLWIGDEAKISFTGNQIKFRRRKKSVVPSGLTTLGAAHSKNAATVQSEALASASGVSTVADMKLHHWMAYANSLDTTKTTSDIFTDSADDYEASAASEAFKEVGSDIYSAHNVSIGKSTAPTTALDVNGTVTATAFSGALSGSDISTGTVAAVRVATLNQNTTGSAATLTTARDIGGVSFNGSANINLPGVNTGGNQNTSGTAAKATKVQVTRDDTGDTSMYLTMTNNDTVGQQDLYMDTDLKYDNTSNTLFATTFSGALSGNATTAGYATSAGSATTATNQSGGTVSATTITSSGIITCNANKMVITGSSPTLYLRDSDSRTGMIHQNADRMYFLSGPANSDVWAKTVNDRWPLYLQTDTNQAVFGGDIDASAGTVSAAAFTGIQVSDVPDLAASKITSGTFDAARFDTTPITNGIHAQYTTSGGGNVTFNSSGYLKWDARIIALPVHSDYGTNNYYSIDCPTSGTIVRIGGTTNDTVICTTAGIPIATWNSLWYEITPGGGQASDQTKFRLTNWGLGANWTPNENWICIGVRNGDTHGSFFKYLPGQVNIPLGGGYKSANGTLTSPTFSGTVTASLLDVNGYTMSKPPRVVHIDDSRSGCPPTQAANTNIMEYSLSLARTAYVYVSVTTILVHTSRADCHIYFGSTHQQSHLTAQDNTNWNPVNITAGGTLSAGTTVISFRSNTPNAVGCGSDWGGMQILIFET